MIQDSARGGKVESSDRVLNFHMLNIRSVRQNLDRYIALLYSNQTHVIVLTESWLGLDDEKTFIISGYRASYGSNADYRAGGVVIFLGECF